MAGEHHPARHLHCHGCGKAMPHKPGQGLHCSEKCEKKHQAGLRRAEKSLTTLGFVQHGEAPNLFMKDGVGITVQEVKAHGLQETLKKHAAAVRANG